jgi:Chaperone of endosialidase
MGIFDIFDTADQRKAADDQIRGIQTGYSQLSDLFGQGRGAINTNYADALAPFTQNFNTSSGGVNAYANASGANGGAGVADALKQFTSSPGYQFQLDQGNQNILRNQGATGQLNSGATNIDLDKFGQGLAGTQFQNYVQNLLPFLQMSQNSAAGIGGVKTGQGNQLNTSFTGQGNAAAGAQTAIGNANANADLAGLTASGNIFGALGGLAKAGAGIGLGLSDKRAKDDIEPVGKLYDGQDVYRYRYKGDSRHQIGLIAQEVEARDPDAVGPIGHFKGVDYRRATDMAAELGKFLKAA